MIAARSGKVALFCLVIATTAHAAEQQNNIPALLQFAEKYQNQQAPVNQQSVPQESKAVKKPALSAGKKPAPTPKQDKSWQLKDGQIRQQQEQIAQLEQQVAALTLTLHKAQAEKPAKLPPAAEPDVKALGMLWQNLRQALAPPPEQQKMLTNLQQAQRQREAQHNIAKELTLKIGSVEKENEALQNQLKALHTKYQTAETQQQQQNAELAALHSEMAKQQATAPAQASAEQLTSPLARQAYAAGVSLGEEILHMQEERQAWGVKADKKLILAGLVDAFSGQRKLADSELNLALSDSEKSVLAARNTQLEKQEKQGEAYLTTFKKQQNVKQATEGFWYRLDYIGDEPIEENAIVDVVVKEMLTDGTVIQDMETSGITLSQKVADFPPLFQAAIKMLKNHGSMRLVAPPGLAYGEKGYPPMIPPNATMVYSLRIADAYPDDKPPAATKDSKDARP